MLLSAEGFVTVLVVAVLPVARLVTSLTIVLATLVPKLELRPVFVSAFVTMLLTVLGFPLARLLVAALRIALATVVPTVELTPVFASAFVTMLLSVEGLLTMLLNEVEFVLVLLSPEELTVVEATVVGEPTLVKLTAPKPGMVPPLVLVKLEPGVVGMLITGITVLPVVELVVPVELTVVPVPVVVPVVGVFGVPVPILPCETTVPTVSTPTDIPWSATFGASRLFAARAWTCNAVRVEVVAEDPEDLVWSGVPTVTLTARRWQRKRL